MLGIFVNTIPQNSACISHYSFREWEKKHHSVVIADFITPGAEDCSAPQHNQIQSFAGRQPDTHLFLQQVSLPNTG